MTALKRMAEQLDLSEGELVEMVLGPTGSELVDRVEKLLAGQPLDARGEALAALARHQARQVAIVEPRFGAGLTKELRATLDALGVKGDDGDDDWTRNPPASGGAGAPEDRHTTKPAPANVRSGGGRGRKAARSHADAVAGPRVRRSAGVRPQDG